MTRTIQAFDTLFPNTPIFEVLDIGSNPNQNSAIPPAYHDLLKRKRCNVTGFEPGPDAFAALQKINASDQRYFPYAIGDGTTQIFYDCALGVLSSLYEPNHQLLQYFYLLGEGAKVVNTFPIETKRLDDLTELKEYRCDYLHIDVQGAELQCFQGGSKLLDNVLAIHAETNFLPMYKNAPMFSEVELFLRGKGFMVHRLDQLQHRTWKPSCLNGDVLAGWMQTFWCDTVFVKSYAEWPKMKPVDLLKTAALMHDVYRAFDLSLAILLTCDQAHGTTYMQTYRAYLAKDVPELITLPKPLAAA
jgi:FkbM family methyltransferase